MAGIPREKIALVVFLAVIALMAACIGLYLVAGHSWNYAATRIDDAAGDLDGYRVVVFEGTAVPEDSRVKASGELDFAPKSLASARMEDEEKGASVFSLDSRNLDAYRDAPVFERGGYRVGVLYAAPDDTVRELGEKTQLLAARDADLVIAFADGDDRLGKVDGIDVIVSLGGKGTSGDSDALEVRMPAVGEVCAITVSPADVVSAGTVVGD